MKIWSFSDVARHARDVDVQNMSEHQTSLIQYHCNHGDLMGDFGLFVQGLLAFVAFLVLIVKRFCEPKATRRNWLIWFYDTSKQGFGATVIHFANVFLADAFKGDPCTWYIINFLLDSTIGLFIIYLACRVTQCIVTKKGWDTLRFGEYGKPPSCNAWIGQCALYILVMIFEKIVITLMVQFKFWDEVRRVMMSVFKDPNVEIVIVMFIVPIIVNAIMFWVVDNILKKKIKLLSSRTTISVPLTSVKYSRADDRIRYHDRAEESEEDVLLSVDEDSEIVRQRLNNDGSNSDTSTHKLLT